MSECEDDTCDSWTGSYLVSYKEGCREEAKSFVQESEYLELEEMLPYQTIALSGPEKVVESLKEISPFETVEKELKGRALSNGNIRPYGEETVIGHYVSARVDETDFFPEVVQERIRETTGGRSPMIEIRTSDVDWEESKSIRVRLETLRKIVEHFDEAEA